MATYTYREKECKAYKETCHKCNKKGHFKRVCTSKKAPSPDKKQKDNTDSEDDSNYMEGGVFRMKAEECIVNSISTVNLVYDTKKRTWVQRKITDKK